MCPPAQIHENKKIRCVLVHDHVLLRQGLRRLLEDEPDVQIVAEAGSATDALRKIYDNGPDVVITDVHIFECAAEQIERLVLQESAKSRVLFLTSLEIETREATPAEGTRCAVRQTSAAELVEMIRRTASANQPTSRYTGEWSIDGMLPRNRILTTREREVLKLLAEGRTVRSAASVLGLSIKTVDAHKFNLMRKLGLHNKAELVMWAIQKRLVKLPASI